MAAVFGSSQDGESENTDATRTLIQAFCGLVLSLVTFFASAKKVTRLQAKAFDLSSQKNEGQGQTHFALTREFISFAGPKETNQRKGPSPTKRNNDLIIGRNFRTRHPWLGPKTARIHARRPTGFQVSLPFATQSKSDIAFLGTS
jgi:hypothetical protein